MRKNNGLLSSDIVTKEKKHFKITRTMPAIVIALSTFWVMTMPVFAANMEQLMKSIINIIFTIFLYVGILLLVWSIAQLVLAFKNEDADSKSRAMTMIVVSVVLIGLKAFINPIIESALEGDLSL